jgi:3-methyl-2-oxobutanoate hydroxymethyltransferase
MPESTLIKVTVPIIRRKKERGEKVVMVTCYDQPSARLLDMAGVDILFVGDSVGNNVLGYPTTIPVTMEEMLHHAKAARRGITNGLMLVDMPFMSYQVTAEEAMANAGRFVKEAGAEAVKVEGGVKMAPTIERMVAAGIPVMGHVGLTPQSLNLFGRYRILGKQPDDAERILSDARALVQAGAFAIVLELVPPLLAKRITEEVPIPTIGIAAGPHCDGQVQVFHDLFGINPDAHFKHVKRYAEVGQTILDSAKRFAADVRDGRFPDSNS